MGPIKSTEEFETQYEVQKVMYIDEIHDLLSKNEIKYLLPINGKSGNQT